MIGVHGRGGHGKVVVDAIKTMCPDEEIVWTDDAEGTSPKGDYIVAIGDPHARASRNGQLTVIHPRACVSASAEIGPGVYVGALASVGPCSIVENGAIVNTGSVVEHDCRIGAYSHVAPHATLCGNVRVGRMALVGAGAVVKPGVTIGDGAIVGCGSVVVKDVPSGETWIGNPAAKMNARR